MRARGAPYGSRWRRAATPPVRKEEMCGAPRQGRRITTDPAKTGHGVQRGPRSSSMGWNPAPLPGRPPTQMGERVPVASLRFATGYLPARLRRAHAGECRRTCWNTTLLIGHQDVQTPGHGAAVPYSSEFGSERCASRNVLGSLNTFAMFIPLRTAPRLTLPVASAAPSWM